MPRFRKSASRSPNQAQPPLEFIAPDINLNVVKLVKLALPLWMRLKTPLTRVEAKNVEQLIDLYQQFQSGKVRLLFAFRHPSVQDPICMGYLLHYLMPKLAKQQGIRLKPPTHAHFMYDRGIPLWAGSLAGWLYSKLGGTPIHRGKLDRVGLRSARDLFANGAFPLLAAPEGATNGHNETISPLEPGIAQIGFWCVEDLIKAGRSEKVLIVPIGIQYRYITPPWKALEKLLSDLEADSGILREANDEKEGHLYRRLYQLAEHLLTVMEEFYTRFYHQTLPTTAAQSSEIEGVSPGSNAEFAVRLEALLNVALQVAEQYFNIQPKGSVIDRCRKLEQAGWDYVFRDDLHLETLSPLERGLADRIAEEASLRIWHMRLVESFVAVTGKYVLEKPTAERFAETTLLMWDVITKIKGGNAFKRPMLGQQCGLVTIGQPISVSDRWDTYHSNRRAGKQAVSDLTQDLQTALESLII
ncbi:1-acyl-sn-glycerol-3-phosphate acyltransferase [Phormidesmis priestleyi ULC007]|uniref:1-acyl-sn-glycerol-3-phosphate acyltransferase n=1 Tax=Phormidesmis priestleyi ULC007 TaxID=1920490 RepID=A0A2T1DBT9_9CYAN|nr:1-acyl-sn-glycerol-3-phosphate acyltransferase [Phormidesmis priestleyi]PSB17923.1 1-acyl-sn-glycerol-3-phosphate acyltransferase [Phormidesmis priestleyi ULC007]PZO53908.1 MAG: 1-acyl-sn-glycerol-3-phosphate acyltransferase [Phormidesmis priestleyi]